MRELDSEGAHYSQDLSEVDLSDSEDVKAVVADPSGAVLVHVGSSDFLRRYKIYLAHLQEWRQQFQKVESVDLRYERQIIVNPDSGPPAKNPHPSPAAPHPAAAKAVVAKSMATKPAAVGPPSAKPIATGKPPAASPPAAQPVAAAKPATLAPTKKPVHGRKPSPRISKATSTGTP